MTAQTAADVAPDVLRHRVLLSYDAIAEGISPEQVVDHIVSTIPAPRVTPTQDGPIVHDPAGMFTADGRAA